MVYENDEEERNNNIKEIHNNLENLIFFFILTYNDTILVLKIKRYVLIV